MVVLSVDDHVASLFYYLLSYLSHTVIYQEMFNLP